MNINYNNNINEKELSNRYEVDSVIVSNTRPWIGIYLESKPGYRSKSDSNIQRIPFNLRCLFRIFRNNRRKPMLCKRSKCVVNIIRANRGCNKTVLLTELCRINSSVAFSTNVLLARKRRNVWNNETLCNNYKFGNIDLVHTASVLQVQAIRQVLLWRLSCNSTNQFCNSIFDSGRVVHNVLYLFSLFSVHSLKDYFCLHH